MLIQNYSRESGSLAYHKDNFITDETTTRLSLFTHVVIITITTQVIYLKVVTSSLPRRGFWSYHSLKQEARKCFPCSHLKIPELQNVSKSLKATRKMKIVCLRVEACLHFSQVCFICVYDHGFHSRRSCPACWTAPVSLWLFQDPVLFKRSDKEV